MKIGFKNIDIHNKLLLSSLLGAILVASLIFIMGIAGLINRYILFFVFIFFIFLAKNYIIIDIREFIHIDKKEKIYLLILVIILLPMFIMTLYPPFQADEISYHLAVVKQYIKTSTITSTPYLRYAVFPRNMEMLFLMPMLFFSNISAHFVSFLAVFYTSMTLYIFCKKHYTKESGMLSAALLISNPIVLWLGSVGYVDAGLMLFVTIGVVSFTEWISTTDNKWLIISSIALGFAAGIKYSALFFVVLISIIVIYKGVKESNYKSIYLFLVLTTLSLLPWYAFNYYYTGNPVWPFFSKIFGIKIWNSNDAKWQLFDLLKAHSENRTLISFIQLPIDLVFKNWNKYKFFTEVPSPLSLLFIGLSFLSYIFVLFKKDNMLRIISVICFLYTAFWFFTAPLIRYFVPIIPLLSIVAAVIVVDFLTKIKLNNQIIILLSFLLISFPGVRYTIHTIRTHGFPPVTEKQRNQFLNAYIPSYKAFSWLNNIISKKCKVYALLDEKEAYYEKGIFLGDWFGPARYSNILDSLKNKANVYDVLKKLNVNYFIVNINRLRGVSKVAYDKMLLWEKQNKGYLKVIYKNKNNIIFKIIDYSKGDKKCL